VRALEQIARRPSAVLGYHGMAECRLSAARENFRMPSTPPARFATQINLLRAAGFHFVTTTALARMAEGGAQPPPGYAAVTFDDGLRSNYTSGLPILNELPPTRTIVAVPGMLIPVCGRAALAASSTYKIHYYAECCSAHNCFWLEWLGNNYISRE
jgi:hypothetical protein